MPCAVQCFDFGLPLSWNPLDLGLLRAAPGVGAGTMAVAFFWSRWFPELRTARRLDGRN